MSKLKHPNVVVYKESFEVGAEAARWRARFSSADVGGAQAAAQAEEDGEDGIRCHQLFIVMGYCEGGDLYNRLKQQRRSGGGGEWHSWECGRASSPPAPQRCCPRAR